MLIELLVIQHLANKRIEQSQKERSSSWALRFQIMKIIDPKQTFLTWLELASFKAIYFANTYVKQELIYEFRYEIELNTSLVSFWCPFLRGKITPLSCAI